MNKRALSLLLAVAMMLALTACGGKEKETADAEQVEEVTPETETPGEPETEEPEVVEPEQIPADPAEEPEAENAPSESVETPKANPVIKPVEKPVETEKPVDTPSEKPAEGQSKPAPSVDLTAFYESVLSTGEWPSMGAMEGETLDAFYPGLSDVTTNQCVVSMAMMGAVVAEIALVEVENAADVETVKGIFQSRIDYQVGDGTNPGGAWYPESIEGWKNNSRIVSNGNYVMMVAYEDADDVVTTFNALFA